LAYSFFGHLLLRKPIPALNGIAAWGNHYDDIITDAVLTDDEGLLVTGYRTDPEQYIDKLIESFIIRMDADGNVGDSILHIGNTRRINSIRELPGNQYLVCGRADTGYIDSHFWVGVINDQLDLIWQTTFGEPFSSFGGEYENDGSSAIPLDNGDLLFAGNIHMASAHSDILVTRFDAIGNVIWQNTMGGSGYEYIRQVMELPDHTLLLLVRSDSEDGDVSGNHGSTDSWVVHLASSGDLIWEKSFGGTQYDDPEAMLLLPSSLIAIVSSTTSGDGDVPSSYGNNDVWLFKIDLSGIIVFNKVYGSEFSEVPMTWQTTQTENS
jgi:hypothetical protein